MSAPVTVRSAEPTDETAVADVVTRAFGAEEGPTVASLVDGLRASGHVRAELVADADGVAGHVMLSRSWVDARRALVEVLVLSPLSVAPEHHGRGVGTALLAAALDAGRDLGAPAVFLEGDPGFYAGRGFAPATPLGFTRPSPRVPEPAFQVALLDADEPWMRGPLVYCDPFWVQDCVGLRDPLLAELEGRLGG